uniref:Uncharacterized protein n=1 Tax=Rhizophora mucronata TaxID=61149 RepID=A0A2P2NZS2_RHIMU
MTRRSKIQ